MKPTRALNPCTALLKDGSRCGKYAKSDQPFCAVHSAGYTPKGAAVPKPKPVTYDERLELFTNNRDPRISMRAIEMLERRRAGADESDPYPWPLFFAAITPEERATLESLVAQFKALKEAVWTRRPDLRPEGV